MPQPDPRVYVKGGSYHNPHPDWFSPLGFIFNPPAAKRRTGFRVFRPVRMEPSNANANQQ